MASERDGGHDRAADGMAAAGSDLPGVTRRGLLVGSAVLLLSACSRGISRLRTDGMWYTVRPGDTLSSMARRSGLALERIVDANGLTTPDLEIGTRLWMPGVYSMSADPAMVREPVRAAAKPPSRPVKPAEPVAEADGTYEIVPRSAWTSKAIGPNHNLMNGVQRITVHHTDEHAGMAGLPDIEVVRRIENYHRGPEKGWAAIGYHYLVGKDGRIYEGRPVQYQGAHVSGANEHNLGISVIGDFNLHLPNTRQLAALRAFLDDQRVRFKVPMRAVYGHRELNASLCPGDALFGWVTRYRA
jgi:N-acetylmuramoyl-L-alanine amidase